LPMLPSKVKLKIMTSSWTVGGASGVASPVLNLSAVAPVRYRVVPR
jgi:hypothetical protein